MRLDPDDHFVGVTDMIEIGKGGKREVEKIHLDRYACYLIAQNGDPRTKDLWKYALLVLSVQPDGTMTTSAMIGSPA